MSRPKQSLAERFWTKVDKRGSDECWLWHGSKFSNGYGQVYVDGRKISAQRVAYELINGAIPAGLDICHTCDNPSCCNPSHLFAGTARENMQDKFRKGRANTPHGEQVKTAKLTASDVYGMHILRQLGWTHRRLAQNYGVSQSLITNILNGKVWRHVNG